jgi:hypothetical protein
MLLDLLNWNNTLRARITYKGKDLGLNLSKVAENAIKSLIEKIETLSSQENPNDTVTQPSKKMMVDWGYPPKILFH